MIDVERFNLYSPYKLKETAVDGFYEFVTDYGIVYLVGFMYDDSIVSRDAYQFIISNAEGRNSPNDPKVRETVINMVDAFFMDTCNALLYICETGDGKQAMRNRLFQYWFSTYEKRADFVFLSSSVIDDDGELNFATIIVHNNNPRLSDIVNEFTNAIKLFNSKPQGGV